MWEGRVVNPANFYNEGVILILVADGAGFVCSNFKVWALNFVVADIFSFCIIGRTFKLFVCHDKLIMSV